ncbi:putative PfkB family carbohydrate kinase [Taphrina deformans PYCC 5710]|uniref:PfkB family carbohydrate kinase n=1 Tax=Taphrina deformans (strain PYCC 5710 / ATCC 11124 / CBS 356.35 / IMI 108563 / JCM 9778 / NBRC 8474) TaxID=1097556 RepID=R4XCE1_TAPDE|nr:putative PfkB family carbohydrate kinase [Taphrina deformans PYCC 5710]|eukprot:CCG83537.1 putative PfkB family carbohydrate kinase [Taphrina deformans PYCC 5710]
MDETDSPRRILFVSLGMFIIDTIVPLSGETLQDIIGGAGTYAAIGSRVFTAPGETGFVVDYGNDVPGSVETTIDGLGLSLLVRRDNRRKCTRGLNTYRGSLRHFEYLTPKIRITPSQLTPSFLRSRTFHLISSPDRTTAQMQELGRLRRDLGCADDALSLWEPVPDCCVPTNKDAFVESAKHVDIVSPNADEAAGLLSYTLQSDVTRQVEQMAHEMRGFGVGTIVIRSAALGSYVSSPDLSKWYPAYLEDQAKVIDATGAGNTFCGALVTLLGQNETLDRAMCGATVAAGLSIMQTGLPELTQSDGLDLWNGAAAKQLVEEYRTRNNMTK